MWNAAVLQNAGAVQEIVDQGVYDDHGLSGLEPNGPVVARAYHKPGERIGQDLVGHAENASERTDQGFLSGSLQIGVRRACGGFQLAIDPAHEVTVSDVPDEQIEAKCELVQPPIPEHWTGYWTGVDMIGLGASEAALVVSAAFVVPEGLELPAGGRDLEACLHFGPGRCPMLLHVAPRGAVGDTLKAERRQEPIEDRRRIAQRDCLIQARLTKFVIDLIDQ